MRAERFIGPCAASLVTTAAFAGGVACRCSGNRFRASQPRTQCLRAPSQRAAPARRLPLGRSCGFQLDFGLALQQGLGLDHQLFAQLVGAPALPAFKLPGGAQRGMHPRFKRSESRWRPCSLNALRKAQPRHRHWLCHGLHRLPAPLSRAPASRQQRRSGAVPRRTAGSTFGLAGLAAASTGRPRAARNCSAHTGTGGSGAAGSASAATACPNAALKASQTTSNCARDDSIIGVYLLSTQAQFAIALQRISLRLPMRRHRPAKAVGHRLCILPAFGRQQLDALCQQHRRPRAGPWPDFAESSTTFMRSASAVFSEASGSRDSGAPALAASRCQAMASAMLRRGGIEQDLSASGPVGGQRVLRLGTAQFVELLTQWTGSALVFDAELLEHFLHQVLGWRTVASHSRMRAARSPGGGRREGTAGKGVELLQIMGFGISVGHGGHSAGLRQKTAVACRHRSVCQPGIFAGFQTPTKAEAGRAAQQGSAMHGRPLFHHGNTAPGACPGRAKVNAGTTQASIHRMCRQPSDLGPATAPDYLTPHRVNTEKSTA
jgi:hypothetical protein